MEKIPVTGEIVPEGGAEFEKSKMKTKLSPLNEVRLPFLVSDGLRASDQFESMIFLEVNFIGIYGVLTCFCRGVSWRSIIPKLQV